MGQTKYIQTESNTTNLMELLFLKLAGLEAKVCTIVPAQEPKQFYTEEEAAKFLCISKKHLYNLRIASDIHYRLVGTSVRYCLADIEEFQERCRR